MAQVISNVKDYKVVANHAVEMFDNVNDVVDYVVMMFKKHPNNAIYVNGLGLRLEMGNDGKWGCFLRDDDWNMIAGYVMGKIKRGLVDAVSYCISRIEINNMEENNMVDMVNKIDLFNEEMKSFVMEDYNDAISSAKDFADAYGDDCVENSYLCGTMDYDYDIREMWADFAWHGDVCDTFKDARDFYDEHKDLFISMEDIDNLVRGLDGTDDVGDGECLVWVRNPYYVSEDAVKNTSPCLERVVDTIKDYVDNYEGMLMNYDGNSASICVPWDVFNEDDMKMLIEDDGFEGCVVGALIGRDIKDVLVYDDGVYVSVDAEKFDNVA